MPLGKKPGFLLLNKDEESNVRKRARFAASSKSSEKSSVASSASSETSATNWSTLANTLISSNTLEQKVKEVPFHLPHVRILQKHKETFAPTPGVERKSYYRRRSMARLAREKTIAYQGSPPIDFHEIFQTLRVPGEYRFSYLLPANEEDGLPNPYSFKEVPFQVIDPTQIYLTISPYGVITHSENSAAFTPLDDYERDYQYYKKLSRMKFFRICRLWKYFYIWRKTVVWNKFKSMQTSLATNLFFMDPDLRILFYKMYNLCSKRLRTSFPDVSRIENFLLEEFIFLQKEKQEVVSENLHDFITYLKSFIIDSLKILIQRADERYRLEQSEKMVFKKKTKEEEIVRLSALEQIKRKLLFEKCSRFLFLVDLFINKIVCYTLKNSYSLLQASLKKHTDALPQDFSPDTLLDLPRPNSVPKIAFFHLNVSATCSKIVLSPDEKAVIGTFENLMNSWENICFQLPRLVEDRDMQFVVSPNIEGKSFGPLLKSSSIKFAVEVDEEICQSRQQILNHLTMNFKVCYAFLDGFKAILEFHQENCVKNTEEIILENDPEKLRDYLVIYNNQLETVQCIRHEQTLGMFILHLEGFINDIRPVCLKLLKITEETLPKLVFSKIANLSSKCDESIKVLQKEPKITPQYVSYLKFIDEINKEIQSFIDRFRYIQRLFEIIKEFNVPCAKKDRDSFNSLSALLNRLKGLCSLKLEEKDNIIKRFGEHMELEIVEETEKILEVHKRILEEWLISKESKIEICLNTLRGLEERLVECEARAAEIKQYQKQFLLEIARFSELEDAMADLKIRQLLWESFSSWQVTVKEYEDGDFNALVVDDVSRFVAKMLKNISQVEKAVPQNSITPDFKRDVTLLKEKVPIISYLRNPALKARHWMQIEGILNHKFAPGEIFTLKQLESYGVLEFAAVLEEVSTQASSEAALESLLRKIENSWKDLEFIVLNYRDAKDVFILGGVEDIQQILDDSFINISTILSSRHVGPIKGRAEEWLRNLDLFSRTLDEWLAFQTNWLYLESIFSAPDIQRQLPTEARLFSNVDKIWKSIMRRTKENPLAMQATIVPGTLEAFENSNYLIDQIMKCLEAYLESKRTVFPRFYFLSNEELLEILAQTRNAQAVQPHLRKCFDAIHKLAFGKDVKEGQPSADILAMISPEGEIVQFIKTIQARGNVEDWLGKVEDIMCKSLKRAMKFALIDYDKKERENWVFDHPCQIVLVVSQIAWTRNVHKVFDNIASCPNGMQDFENKIFKNLNKLADMVRGELTSLERSVLCSLITLDVHARDIITQLIVEKIKKSDSFSWLKSIRYYWDPELDGCIVRMSTAQNIYSYEYLGASPRLVVTPLTDKCYLCLMGALQLNLGGAPSGPAGTGKTETTKDLAKALAVLCVVFNCSESLDFKMMGRFFSGLASCGAWCCFDEFNRIDIEVLSVIAQQLLTIRNAKLAKLSRFMFEGREIKLSPRCAVFITMNPGYAGRTELPDNLKSLFRPMAMMIPDYALIAEVILYSEGFLSSKILAHKMTQMYKLCSEQLSQQNHYDFGMRALKSVLIMAGQLKRANPTIHEDIVLIRALRDSNIPKFLANDVLLFQGILNDMSPGLVIPEQDYGILEKAIKQELLKNSLQPEKSTIKKVIQFYETLVVRHGVMLVGPTGGGKSTVLRTLKFALTQLHADEVEHFDYRPVVTYIMNPKAVTIGELYGDVNTVTQEWKDGILGVAVRTAVQSDNDSHNWIVCDGPVDAMWIENMNTVLDDNKMLCLANSERIKLTPRVRMVFEVQDLAQASPATVSRCGMIYVDPLELGWRPFMKTWVATNLMKTKYPKEYVDFLISLFDLYVNGALAYVHRNCSYLIHQVDISKIGALCHLLESFFILPDVFEPDNIKNPKTIQQIITMYFLFALLWTVGGNLVEKNLPQYEFFLRNLFENDPNVVIPQEESLWNFYVDYKSVSFMNWNNLVPIFEYNPETPFFEMLVPTADTIRFGFLLRQLISVGQGVLFTGPTGVGKSVIARTELTSLSLNSDCIPNFMNFSAQTNSARVQEMIEMKLDKKKKTLLGAPAGKKIVVFVDDVNMPALDTYGSQPPIELLRQFLDYQGLYDREKLFWRNIQDVVICAGCAPPGGGRNSLTPRFIRHFVVQGIPTASDEVLDTIFQAILKGFLKDFVPSVKALAESIVRTARAVYKRAVSDLLPTPTKSHYVFNLRDLSKCVQGILQADSGTIREPKTILRLFYHECLRVFSDRLNCVEDKAFFYRTMKELCTENFGTPVLDFDDSTLEYSPPMLIFGHFMNPTANEKIYEEVKSLEKLKDTLEECLNDYNVANCKNVKLVFFHDAIEHCCRLARILSAEKGNGLLVGLGGMGKQSLARLASHLNGYRCIQIELTQNYDYVAFQADLRKLFFSAGVEGLNTTFLITDSQIIHEEFLEDISNILNSGEVPNLFEADEYEKIIQGMRTFCKNPSIEGLTREQIFDLFVSRARDRLHLIVCMSPVGDSFRRRCRTFPSLINCCTIDWFLPWPTEALLSVAENSMRTVMEEDLGQKLSEICVLMHQSVEAMTIRLLVEKRRYFYTTPSTYLQLLKQFKEMLATKTDEIRLARDRFGNGLKKLYETNAIVDTMKHELVVLEPLLLKKSQATNELLKILTKEQAAADKVRQVVLADEAVAKEKAQETQLLADDAQKDLAEAMPAMEIAIKALDALNKNDIAELKVFNKPPDLVKLVMEAVCLLLNVKQDWASARVLLSDVNFLKRLQEFDKEHMSENMLKTLRAKFINNGDFIPDKVATQSKVCKSLCMWVRALDFFAKVYKVVEPKRRAVEQAEAELNQIMNVLREKQRKLAEVEAEIANLESKLDTSTNEMKKVQDMMALTSARLNRSGRLTSALGDEQVRWETQVQKFTERLHNMTGDILLSAACVAYHGPFPSDFREELITSWLEECSKRKIPASTNFSIVSILGDPYDIRCWTVYGLPRDAVSAENAILVTQSEKCPLIIDPQGQANRWIRGLEAEHGLKVLRQDEANLMTHLGAAVRSGIPVLLEDVRDTLDPSLESLLLKQTFTQGGLLVIRLGDSTIEYDSNFRLYLTTKLANPHYMPETCILVTLINFTVTITGLEDQLLADVVRLERPDLEKTRTELISRINADKGQLKAIEEKILKLLFTSTGNILDDEELIDTLNESKETSEVVAMRLEEAETTEEKISQARNKYRAVATRGSILFWVVSQLSLVDPMYQYSLKYFLQVFNNVIESSKKLPDLMARVKLLISEITLAVYVNISRGLFERHKLVFSFLMCGTIMKEANEISDVYWNFLLHGAQKSIGVAEEKSHYSHVSDKAWQTVQYLSREFPVFKNFPLDLKHSFVINLGDLKDNLVGIDDSIPSINWDKHLTDFEKLMLFRAVKEEQLVFAITEFVKLNLGKKFIESPSISLPQLYADTSNVTPLVFILSPGSDPFGAFYKFAASKNFLGKVQSISLGQGQGPIAERLLTNGALQGDWIFLQNCHLATSWMPFMERKFLSIVENVEKIHSEFRIFLSSMPFEAFPVAVLQNSVKVTNEPPRGIRANLQRSLLDMSKSFFEDNPLQTNWRKMVFGICFFHAYIQERKKFGPLGWNIAYEFNDSDRDCALNVLKVFCIELNIPWDALEYTTGEITYGGRVTDSWDLRCLKTALKKFFSVDSLASDYKFSKSGIYFCPESDVCNNLRGYKGYVDGLPLIEDAEIFGMSENANVVFKMRETDALFRTILEMQPRKTAVSGAKTDDEVAIELANEIQRKIVPKINTDLMNDSVIRKDIEGRMKPLTTFLMQEVDKFNQLLSIVNTSIQELKKAIKGEVVMSELLENVYTAFINNQVPKLWSKVAYPSLKSLAGWIHDLELRIDFIQCWAVFGKPSSFWISGLYFPQGFLTAVLQKFAREHHTPIDQLKFSFHVQTDYLNQDKIWESHKHMGRDDADTYNNVTPPKDGILIHGLFLEAARWDSQSNQLEDSPPGEMLTVMPILHLEPTTLTAPKTSETYICPLYKTAERAGILSTTGSSTNFVLEIPLPTNRDPQTWVLMGTALLTQTRE